MTKPSLGAIDMARVGRAVSHPGIDPRTWISLAIVTSVYINKDEGPLVGVQLMPSSDEHTARVGLVYGGHGWGVYAPLHVDDEVLVAVPSGHPDEGVVIIARLWSAADPPPVADLTTSSDAITDSVIDDLVLHVEDGKNVHIITTGDGGVTIDSGDNADIVFNGGTKKVARIDAGDKTEVHDHTFALTAGPFTVTGTINTHAGLELKTGGADKVKA